MLASISTHASGRFPPPQGRSRGRSAAYREALRPSRFACGALRPASASFLRTAVIIMMPGAHDPLAATDFPREGSRCRGGCERLMRRRTDLIGVLHGPTSCTLDATLCNCNPTLHRRGPTYLPRLAHRAGRRANAATVGSHGARAPRNAVHVWRHGARAASTCRGRGDHAARRLSHGAAKSVSRRVGNATRPIMDNPRPDSGRVLGTATRARIAARRSRSARDDPLRARPAKRPIAVRPRMV